MKQGCQVHTAPGQNLLIRDCTIRTRTYPSAQSAPFPLPLGSDLEMNRQRQCLLPDLVHPPELQEAHGEGSDALGFAQQTTLPQSSLHAQSTKQEYIWIYLLGVLIVSGEISLAHCLTRIFS